MKRQGIVAALSPQGDVVAIETEGQGFTIVDVHADDVFRREEVVEWKGSSAAGTEVFRNVTRGTLVRVKVRLHEGSPRDVRVALVPEEEARREW